jgi:hypothetical protein
MRESILNARSAWIPAAAAIAVPAALGGLGWDMRWSLAWGALLALHVTIVKPILRRGGLPTHGVAVFLVTCPPGLVLFAAVAAAAHRAAAYVVR